MLFLVDYAIATPTGQLLTTSTFGGLTYAFSQSPFVVMQPPNHVQSFVYSPVSTVAPTQYTLPNTVRFSLFFVENESTELFPNCRYLIRIALLYVIRRKAIGKLL